MSHNSEVDIDYESLPIGAGKLHIPHSIVFMLVWWSTCSPSLGPGSGSGSEPGFGAEKG